MRIGHALSIVIPVLEAFSLIPFKLSLLMPFGLLDK
jgi:hypothetical protein